MERTLAEAQDALRRGRNAPRDSSFGLPNLDQKLVLRFSRSDLDKVRTWIERACATVAASTGIEDVSLEQAILFLCEQGMIGRSVDGGTGPDDRSASPRRAQIVYQHCPDCRKARVGTREGFVEVESQEVERYTDCAEHVGIDGPTPPALRRRVLAREGRRCGNPRCHNPADHCHHIVFRAGGGKTELENEVGVCRTCHALIHAGLLRVTGDANGELQWLPVGAGGSLAREVASDGAAAHVDYTGTCQLEAHLKGEGTIGDIAKRLDGSFTLSAKDGRILKSKSLDKTFDLLNESDNFKGQFPDLDREIISYEVLNVRGEIQEHMIQIEEVMIDSSVIGITARGYVDLGDETLDLSALVSPLKTASKVVRNIPVLGHILGGNLVSIPVRISGNMKDPQVKFLSPSAIGSEVVGMAKRTLNPSPNGSCPD